MAVGSPRDTRLVIVAAASATFASDPDASIETVARAAHVSRATFYRHFRSRAELLAACDIEPDPGSRERILAAAAVLVGRDGLRYLSMDELAAEAGVSRASVYRLFPGKAALFDALLERYSPFAELLDVLEASEGRPADEVLPALTQASAGAAAPRVGILRSLFLEVMSGTPDALAGADPRILRVVGALAGYLAGEMAVGRVRAMHPVLAAQALIGPIVFHLLARAEAEHVGVLDVSVEAAVRQLTDAVLHGLIDPAAASG